MPPELGILIPALCILAVGGLLYGVAQYFGR